MEGRYCPTHMEKKWKNKKTRSIIGFDLIIWVWNFILNGFGCCGWSKDSWLFSLSRYIMFESLNELANADRICSSFRCPFRISFWAPFVACTNCRWTDLIMDCLSNTTCAFDRLKLNRCKYMAPTYVDMQALKYQLSYDNHISFFRFCFIQFGKICVITFFTWSESFFLSFMCFFQQA